MNMYIPSLEEKVEIVFQVLHIHLDMDLHKKHVSL